MSKNLTRKGLALTSVVALGASFFTGSPVFAADLGLNNGSVSLAPNAGSNYAVLTDSTFVLKANSASGVTGSGKYLKFKVSDLDAKVSAASIYGVATSAYATSNGTGSNGAPTGAANNLVTVTVASGHKIKVGDKISVVADSATPTAQVGIDASGVAVTAVSTTSISYVRTDALVSSVSGTFVGRVTLTPSNGATRGAATSFILDSKIDTNTANKTISLTSSDALASHSVDVTAWIDDNDNGVIDATEHQSPTRTVKFLIPGDVVSTTTIRPASAGDASITADVTTVPALNGDLITDAANKIAVTFARPNDAALPSTNATWSDDDQKWTATSADFDAAGWTDTYASLPSGFTSSATAQVSVKVVKDVVTATFAAVHGLRVGDKIVVPVTNGVTALAAASSTTAVTITSVPTTKSFTYSVVTAGATDVVATDGYVDATHKFAYTLNTVLRKFVEAGTVTAQAYIYRAETSALVKNGSLASYAVSTKVANSITVAGVGSATVSADGTAVYKGTASAAFSATIKNVDLDAVAAGIDVTIVASKSSAGVVTLNGTTLAATNTTIYAKTDANGKVAIAVTNTSGATGDTVTFSVASQGVSPVSKTAKWADKVYSILDLNDQTAAGTARNRAVADGAAYTFDLLVQDQFKAPAGADIRLVVAATGNTVSTNAVALTAGKASVAVADGGLTTGATTVSVIVQKLTDSTWAAIDTAAVDWDGSTSTLPDLGTVAINYYSQTDAVTMNANSANYPSATTAVLTAAVTAATPVALDSRVANGSAPAVLTAGKGVVSGKVTNAATGAAKSGAVVTLAAAGLLFKSGDVWSIGSASVLSNDGTFDVEVYSASAGAKKVTVTSGAATSSSTVTFSGTSTDKKVLTLTTPVSVLAGATLSANILLVDGNGNAVDTVAPAATPVAAYIKVSYDGPGLLSGSLPTETDSDGKANVRYLTGVSDAGIATITVKYDQNFDGDFTDATDIVVTKTVLIGSSAVVSANASVAGIKGFAAVTVRNASGKAVTVTVNGRVLTPRAPNVAAQLFKFRATAGKNTVVVKVDGVTVSSRTVSVK